MIMDDEPDESEYTQLSLAEHMHTWRTSTGLSVEEVAAQLSVRPQVVEAFEQGDYRIFPARVYASGNLKRITDHFSIPRADVLADILRAEWEEKGSAQRLFVRAFPRRRSNRFFVTPRRLMGAVGSVGLLFFGWFLIVQIMGFTGAPVLAIIEPRLDAQQEIPIVRIAGTTEKESQLTVNGRDIKMNEKGEFNEIIELPYGISALHFLVQNRFGKITQETRYVVIK